MTVTNASCENTTDLKRKFRQYHSLIIIIQRNYLYMSRLEEPASSGSLTFILAHRSLYFIAHTNPWVTGLVKQNPEILIIHFYGIELPITIKLDVTLTPYSKENVNRLRES